VIKDGSVVSEYSGQQQPMRHNFIERNRIIAALSDILLVTEAAQNSGSLHTAQFALELGRTVYAVPGPIDSPTSQGTNNLIKSGATPATSPDDILEELGLANQTVEYLPEDEEESKILKLIKEGCLEGGMLLALSELKPEIFQQKLTILEIKGVIASVGNNNWSLK
jgi:DNA processing protein